MALEIATAVRVMQVALAVVETGAPAVVDLAVRAHQDKETTAGQVLRGVSQVVAQVMVRAVVVAQVL